MLFAINLAAGLLFVAASVVAWNRSRRYAFLLLAAGLGWFAGDAAEPLLLVHRPLLLHAALAFPYGRFASRFPLSVVVSAWLLAAVPTIGIRPAWMVGLAALTAAAAWRVRWRPSLRHRPFATGSARSLAALAAAFAAPPVIRLVGPADWSAYAAVVAYSVLIGIAGLILGSELVRQPRGWETDAVIELSQVTPMSTISELRVEADLRRNPTSRASLLAAADLLESNLALQAELAARVVEVRTSREELVEAAIAERRQLGQLLADGPLRDLALLESVLGAVRTSSDGRTRAAAVACRDEIARTRADLEQLGRGLHPRTLTDRGLHEALKELVAACAVPVALSVPRDRFPPSAETTLWYACAEALTNVVKHAQATTASVAVNVYDGELRARIADDGIGGARLITGGGLSGLSDRLNSAGGWLRVEPTARGTVLELAVPVR